MSEIRVTRKPVPSPAQRSWLRRGVDQPGGKLPLFDEYGKQVDPRTVQACLQQGWAEPWFANPTKQDWLVCKLTAEGRRAAAAKPIAAAKPLQSTPEREKTNA